MQVLDAAQSDKRQRSLKMYLPGGTQRRALRRVTAVLYFKEHDDQIKKNELEDYCKQSAGSS
jgi:hypothetical protein